MKHYLTVAGNIATGKSTLVELLAQRLGFHPFFEDVSQHPYLTDYYRHMERWSFQSQLYFLLQSFKQQSAITIGDVSACQERSIYEHFGVFVTSLHEQNILLPQAYEILKELFLVMQSLVAKPRLLIWLRASTPTLVQRIKSRDRVFEREIAYEYLDALNKRYAAWVESFDLCPVLRIDCDTLDFVGKREALDLIIANVETCLEGKAGY